MPHDDTLSPPRAQICVKLQVDRYKFSIRGVREEQALSVGGGDRKGIKQQLITSKCWIAEPQSLFDLEPLPHSRITRFKTHEMIESTNVLKTPSFRSPDNKKVNNGSFFQFFPQTYESFDGDRAAELWANATVWWASYWALASATGGLGRKPLVALKKMPPSPTWLGPPAAPASPCWPWACLPTGTVAAVKTASPPQPLPLAFRGLPRLTNAEPTQTPVEANTEALNLFHFRAVTRLTKSDYE